MNKVYYEQNNTELNDIINLINHHFYCCITREPIEFNCCKITIQLANDPAIRLIDELLEELILH
jgi:hypothetical protein